MVIYDWRRADCFDELIHDQQDLIIGNNVEGNANGRAGARKLSVLVLSKAQQEYRHALHYCWCLEESIGRDDAEHPMERFSFQ